MAQANRTIREGLVVGLIGYFAVAVFYAIFDILAARGALHTVNILGQAIFRGLRDPGVLGMPMQTDMTAIVWYSVLHLVVSLLIGLIVTGLVAYSEREPAKSSLVLFVLVAGFVVTIFGIGLMTGGMRPVLPWWSIVVANVVAVILAGTYLLKKRPGAWQRLNPFSK